MYKDINHTNLSIFLQIIKSKPLDKKVLECIISLYPCIKKCSIKKIMELSLFL